MSETGAGKKAERLERPRRIGGGTAERTGLARQADTARAGETGDGAVVSMEEVVRRENVTAAYQRVVRNGGAPGVDGVTVDELKGYCQAHWERIRQELLEGLYQPQAVRKVEIPKPEGGRRLLGIPTVLDRMIQQAVLQILQPFFDPTFSDDSYGFRPKRSAHQVVKRAQEHILAGYDWVVDLDLERFFDRVNHDVLMARVARRVKDKQILRLIRRYLQAGLMEGGLVSPRTEGTPQGGPLSPLLSNILLDDMDKELEQRGHRFARYADDCNVYVQSKRAGERVMTSLESFLSKRLRLRINRDKSAVARPWARKFLGYTVTTSRKLKVAPQSLRRLQGRIRVLCRQARGWRLDRLIEVLRPVIRGWVAYFQLSEVKVAFERLDKWLRRRVRCILWRQWKRPLTRQRCLIRLGLDPDRAHRSASNGRGPWWNAGASHMNQAIPLAWLRRRGLMSFLDQYQRLVSAS